MTQTAYIGFGSNLGDSLSILEKVKEEISHCSNVLLKRVSPLYRSSPVEVIDSQDDFLNAVIEVETSLEPETLLMELAAIEDRNGRVRGKIRNMARTVDLDILLVGNKIVNSDVLTLPHPRISQRAFVLYPLFDLSPELEIPGQGVVRLLIENVTDQQLIKL